MPAVPKWASPIQFDVTNPYNGTLILNVLSDRLYLLDQENCSFDITVRSTTDDVPQADGSILHHRFLTGTQMQLAIQLWESADTVACDALLAEMVGDLTGAFRSLLNAGDNAGRLTWQVDGGNDRILDDIRLLAYPAFTMSGPLGIVTVTIDSQYPYAQDLTQQLTTITDGNTAVLANTGSADYLPVFQVSNLSGSTFTLENVTTGIEFNYNDALPGGIAITGANYAEIDTFRNTIFLNGSGANLKAGVVQLSSDYWALVAGNNTVGITGADVDILWAPAHG